MNKKTPDQASTSDDLPSTDWFEVDWNAVDCQRAKKRMKEAREITVALCGHFLERAHFKPKQRTLFDVAANDAADAADKLDELCDVIDRLMKSEQDNEG